MRLSKAAILAAKDIKTETVKVPEWADSDGADEVVVRGLTGEERDAFENGFFSGRGKDRKENFDNMRARLLAASIIDDQDRLMFSADEIHALGKKSAVPLDRLYGAARRLSGIGDADVEEMVGNSKPGQNGSSTSGSPSVSG